MKVKITYPHIEKKKRHRQDIINWIKWSFLSSASICIFLNLVIGGSLWSLIVTWALWIAWSFIIWPDLVECNRISLWMRLVTGTAVLLSIITILYAPNAATEGLPLVWFIGISVAGVLFFTDLERQKQNMMPMIMLIAICLIFSVRGIIVGRITWEIIAMGISAFILLIACFLVLRNGFLREIKKRFHVR